MPNQAVQLIKANTGHVPIIAKLAHSIWNQHYPAIISQEQINYMLDLMYSDKSLIEQMTAKGHDFYLIEQNGKTIGFISVSKIKEIENGYFLHKFYLDQNQVGKGTGTLAHNALIKL